MNVTNFSQHPVGARRDGKPDGRDLGFGAGEGLPGHRHQTTITPTSQVAGFLASHHVTVSAIGPATISGGAVTLPIAGGFVTKSTNGGLLRHTGGLKFTVGSRSVAVTHFVLIAHKVHGRLLAWVGGRRITVARLINASRTVSGKTGTLTGELTLSAAAAHKINKRLGKHIVTGRH